jgi:hypothetical protein
MPEVNFRLVGNDELQRIGLGSRVAIIRRRLEALKIPISYEHRIGKGMHIAISSAYLPQIYAWLEERAKRAAQRREKAGLAKPVLGEELQKPLFPEIDLDEVPDWAHELIRRVRAIYTATSFAIQSLTAVHEILARIENREPVDNDCRQCPVPDQVFEGGIAPESVVNRD